MTKRLAVAVVAALLIPAWAWAASLTATWTANTEPDIKGYRVYIATSAGGPYTKLGDVTSPSYSWPIPTGTEGMRYFVVTAYDNAGNESGYSNEASLYVDVVSPLAPKGLQITIIIALPPVP